MSDKSDEAATDFVMNVDTFGAAKDDGIATLSAAFEKYAAEAVAEERERCGGIATRCAEAAKRRIEINETDGGVMLAKGLAVALEMVAADILIRQGTPDAL